MQHEWRVGKQREEAEVVEDPLPRVARYRSARSGSAIEVLSPFGAGGVGFRNMAIAALLTRLLVRQLGGELSRTKLGVLKTLGGGSRRITELADLEGLAQPTITILIKQLEEKGLVTRTRHSEDGRVVLVTLTESGNAALEDYRDELRFVLGEYLAEIADEQIEALATATETLAQLVDLLQQRPTR